MAGYNPIALVGTEIDNEGNILNGVELPAPSSYQYEWEDISKSNSGRTQDVAMNVNRIGRIISISLSWEKITISDCSTILNAFNSEYVYVKYLDAKEGKFVTREFYVGSISTPLFNTKIGKWENLSFKITSRRNSL